MSLRPSLIIAAAALASASAIAQDKPAAQKDPAASQSPPPEIKALAESCSARKFETTVEIIVDGKLRSSMVKLCGKEGQTDADWANTLKDAVKKVEANEKMAPTVKNQISAAFNAEIAKIEGLKAASAPPVATSPAAGPESATLPPLATAPAAAIQSAPPSPAPRKPRLTIRCVTPAELGGGGSCISMRRNTVLTIRADEQLAGGARLRFLRGKDVRGEISLAQMRQGQSLRFKLPQPLCAGVYRSSVEIQILGPAASGTGVNPVVDTLGPFELRC